MNDLLSTISNDQVKKMNLRQKFLWKIRTGVLPYIFLFAVLIGMPSEIYANEPEKSLPSGISYSEIGSKIEDFVEEHQETTAAMETAVFDKDGIVYRNSFGYTDMEKQTPVDESSVFEWGSTSKTLVWVSVMQLWEQGKIDLNADISIYLPEEFLTNLNYDTPITMINLMNHNAGFQDMLSDLFLEDAGLVSPLGEQLKLHEPEQIFEPGAVTAYSNWGVGLAAYAVEQVSGQTFDSYVKEHIFEKLDMNHTAIRPDLSDNMWVKEQRDKLQCYTTEGGELGTSAYAISIYPVGMCTSTMDDFLNYARALLPGNGNCVLFEKGGTLEEMLSATSYYGDSGVPRSCHGFWTEEYGVSVVGHGGNTAGCSSYLRMDPASGTGMVIMTNQQNEKVYNSRMPELVFGRYKDSELSKYNSELVGGLFEPARTIRKGPLSLGSVGFLTMDDSDWDQFWVQDNQNNVEKISYAYGDLIRLSAKDYIPRIILLVFLAAGVIYALLTCVVGGCIVRPVLWYRRKKLGLQPEKNPFTVWNYSACGLILLWTANLLLLVMQASSYAPGSSYQWQFVLFAVQGILMLFMIVWICIKACNRTQRLRSIIKYLITSVFLLVVLCNILFWDMYQFWAL